MTTELRLRNQSQQMYVRAISAQWRSNIQLHDPSLWLLRDPEIESKMLRDADIAAPVGLRQHMIAGRDWNLTPRIETSPRAPMAVHVGTEILKHVRRFTEARKNLGLAFLSGTRFARIHGQAKKMVLGDGKVRTWWVPTRLEDLDKRMYRIVPRHDTNDPGNLSAFWERWDVGRAEFVPETVVEAMQTIRHSYGDTQASLGYGTGLREALGWWWYAKEHVFSETLQAVEKHAQGMTHVKLEMMRDAETGLPNSELVDATINEIERMRARHVLVTDKLDEIETVAGNAEGWQLLQDVRAELKTSITTLILGANLPTTATEGGSYALGQEQANTTEALIQFDRETLEETLTASLVRCVWFKNWANMVDLGIEGEAPIFTITQEKRQDPKERAEVASMLSIMGMDLAAEDVYEQTGFRAPEDGEEIVEGGSGFETDIFGQPSAGVAAPGFELEQTAGEAEVDHQDTALNGAQVQAAAELIDRVVNNAMPPGTALRMLVSMFNLPVRIAQEMVDEAVRFTPAPQPVPAAPPVPTGHPAVP